MVIIYFSGTGNTKHLSNLLACSLEIKAYSIEDEATIQAIKENKDIIFAYPIYGSNYPQIVKNFIVDHGDLWNEKEVMILVTCGFVYGGAIVNAMGLFHRYGAIIRGSEFFVMPDNIGDSKFIVTLLNPKRNKKVLDKADKKILLLADSIKNKAYPKSGQKKKANDKMFNSPNPKIDSSKCIKCNLCKINCPSPNKCTFCYRCYNICPVKAITIFGSKVILQYLHPDFEIKTT
jgi:Pyruvate/2-oxoacid:ferredoxin oxidoreductase delta subunit